MMRGVQGEQLPAAGHQYPAAAAGAGQQPADGGRVGHVVDHQQQPALCAMRARYSAARFSQLPGKRAVQAPHAEKLADSVQRGAGSAARRPHARQQLAIGEALPELVRGPHGQRRLARPYETPIQARFTRSGAFLLIAATSALSSASRPVKSSASRRGCAACSSTSPGPVCCSAAGSAGWPGGPPGHR